MLLTLTTLLSTLLLLAPLSQTTPLAPNRILHLPHGLPRRSSNGTLLPPPTSNNTTLHPRDQNIGHDSHLTIKFYTSPGCEISIVSMWEDIRYNDQMFGTSASFSLSRDLIDKEVLDFSTGTGIPLEFVGMQSGQSMKGAQYPGPGYMNGGFKVPSECDDFFWSLGNLAPWRSPQGQLCYTPPKVFNCARLWMQS